MTTSHNISDVFYTSWDQLDPKQAIQLLLLKQKMDQLEKAEFFEQMGQIQYAILSMLCKKDKVMRKLDEGQLLDIAEDLKMFWMQPFHFFHIRQIKGEHFTYHSPDEKMHDLRFEHLVYADAFFTRYLIADEQLILDQMIAVLYSPESKGVRWPFNLKSIEAMALDIGNHLHRHEKLLIMTTYGHIRDFLIQRCPNLFVQQPDKNSDGGQIKYSGEDWRDILYDLSETPAYQGIDNAKKAPLIEALDYLEKKAIEALKYKHPAYGS